MKKLNVEHIYKRCNQMRLVKDGKDHPGYMMTTLACSIIKLTDNPDYSVLYRNDTTTEEQVQHMLESSVTQNPASCQSFTNANPEGCMNCLENVRSPLLLANDYITIQLNVPEKVETVVEEKESEQVIPKPNDLYFNLCVNLLNHALLDNLDKTLIVKGNGGKGSQFYAVSDSVPSKSLSIVSYPDIGIVTVTEKFLVDTVIKGQLGTGGFYGFIDTMNKYHVTQQWDLNRITKFTDYVAGIVNTITFDVSKLTPTNYEGSWK